MSEVQATYQTGDPGDEQAAPGMVEYVRRDGTRYLKPVGWAPAILPQYDDLADCILRSAALITHPAIWCDADWLERQAVRRLVLELAGRLGENR